MIVLCDLDGVVFDFIRSFRHRYQEAGGHVPEGWVPEFYDAISDLPDQAAVADAWENPNLFRWAEPFPGAVGALQRLNEKHDLRIVTTIIEPWATHVPGRMKALEVHCPFISIDQVYIAHDKTLIDGDLFIEDYPPNLRKWLVHRDLTSARGVLVDQPYNQENNLDGLDRWDLPVRWDRVPSLKTIVKRLTK